MFRILSEFVEGFETLSDIGPAVTVFGSARTKSDDLYYQKAVECSRKLVEKDFAVITGGGPGIMEAANKGAFEAGGTSVGLAVALIVCACDEARMPASHVLARRPGRAGHCYSSACVTCIV